ncbi:protein FAM136A [Nilaparvata lugens]|uniref:protein FAM136A n=1 Tax=Nilaparvata lugens TaxID=108931 RepID=UPI00193E6F79|nr:protein FAM136A [Nilaparvata lugens]XP_039280814.1 protein FAM136A [Nilaparvata lugens]
MVDKATQQLEDAIKKLEEDLDRSYLRRLHGEMYSCAAKCCARTSDSVQQVKECVDLCRRPVDQAWDDVESEISVFQVNLSNCLMDCGQSVRKAYSGSNVPTPEKMANYDKEMLDCAGNCLQRMLKAVPDMQRRMSKTLEKVTITKK